jgi:hypothetical protein
MGITLSSVGPDEEIFSQPMMMMMTRLLLEYL